MTAYDPGPNQFQGLFESCPDPMAIVSDGMLREVNRAWQELTGWGPADLAASPLMSFVHPDDAASTERQLANIAEQGSSRTLRSRFRCRDGSHRTLSWSMCISAGVVYIIARDIGEYLEMRERAERSEAVAVAVLRTAVDPIIVIDPDGTIVDANRATSRLFGYSTAELLGRNVSTLMPEPYRSEHDQYLHRYLTEGDPRIIGIGREVVARRADGSVFPIALAVSEVKTETEHLFTGIVHDLTERNRQRNELERANEQLEERVADRTGELERSLAELSRSNRDLEQFAYIASHDLQAPLRNVRQGLELLDEHLEATVGAGFDNEAHELRELVVAAVVRMEDLIKGLLAYSRVQRDAKVERETVVLDEVVADVLEANSLDLDEAEAVVEVGALGAVLGHRSQLVQVFHNLIQNAIRYRSPMRPLRISIGATHRIDAAGSDAVVVSVSDNGVGIDESHHDRIFELFRRGHAGYEGVGLGLAICQRIVERHGGTIWVESSVDAGADFRFTLEPAQVDRRPDHDGHEGAPSAAMPRT